MTAIKFELNRGTYLLDDSITFGEWLFMWLESDKRKSIRHSTYLYYLSIAKNHIVSIADIKLVDLKPIHLNKLYNTLTLNGNRITGKGLNAKTIARVNVLIHSALDGAIANDLIKTNASSFVSLPKAVPNEMNFLTQTEVKNFLKFIESDRMYAAFYILCSTGCRRGELLGIRYQDVDFATGSIKIEQTVLNNIEPKVEGQDRLQYMFGKPKTKKSQREIFIAKSAVDVLKEHKKKHNLEKLKMGELYNDFDLIFTQLDGLPLTPNLFTNQFKRLIKASGIERHIRLHDVRHTVASFLLNSTQNNPKIVQELLGHSTISTTLDIYSHVSSEKKKEVADELEKLVTNKL